MTGARGPRPGPGPEDAVTATTRVVPGGVVDSLTRAEGTVVLVEAEPGAAHVVRLSALGVAVLELVGTGSVATAGELAERLVARLGPPPGDPLEAVAGALSDMSRLGVIRLVH